MRRPQGAAVVDFVPVHVVEPVVERVVGGVVVEVAADRGALRTGKWGKKRGRCHEWGAKKEGNYNDEKSVQNTTEDCRLSWSQWYSITGRENKRP